MRILFMGTPEFSVPTLRSLIESEHEVVGVVTQPDRAKGRGKQVQFTPVKETAVEAGIAIYQPTKITEEGFIEKMSALDIDLAVVIAFGQILPKAFLDMPQYGCINIHASLLPKYRGSAPIQWTIINGETVTGLTTMYMAKGIDTGDMLFNVEVPIEKKETGGSLHDKLSVLGGPLILETIKALEDHTLLRVKQDDEASTYVPLLSKDMGSINWNKTAQEIERLIRGLNPWPSAYTYIGDRMIKVWEADVVPSQESYEPGSVCEITKEGMVVQCREDGLLIRTLQMQGKKRMSTADFLRGYTIDVGEILGKSWTAKDEE